ncbi:MAG TPA: glycoside hydrolase family 2 TIM barrel-domain containing protein [Actinophytocola sp.]|uniref:glycoside hydrolase family 2 TIM barrel-domain containing protein n=1 Tax=Actinophytocola sp. TaxID=1872138 RepID=UPI002E006359|nr:glycoside hydrolase family 2 TIM barrel-domain containing protein [Actinophytocola sp.]
MARRPAGVLLAAVLMAAMGAGVSVAAPDDRGARGAERSAGFDRAWKFALVNAAGITDPTGAYARAQEPGFDDSAWRTLDLPHDWSIELDPTETGGTNSGTGFLQGGLGWYRKTFTLPRSLAGKRISLEFDGIYMDSTVYLNGQQVASHAYGYTGFAADLTALAHTDGRTPNVVAVKVQNQLPSSRWYSGSGIYRNVHLVVTEPVHVARHGVFVTTPDVASTIGSGFATVRAQTTARNDGGGSTAQATVVSTVEDARGKRMASGRTELSLGADPGTATVDLRVDHPTLWSITNPYLYTLRTQVIVAGRTVDTTTTRFGIRWAVFDPNGGFALNGVPTKLYGVDLHHDLGALGAAVNKDAIVRQMQIMKSMGVNSFRTSHNPPSPEMIEVCEELGIVMMVEAFDTWRTPKVPFDYGRFFDANSDADVAEMVHAAKNSPAVVLWSIGNEIPDSTNATVGVPIARRLIADVKAIDTTRPIVMGSDKYRSVPAPGSAQDQILQLLDGMGLNYNTAGSVDGLHARYPTKFFFESESSSETSTRGVYQDPHLLNTGENYTPGKRGTSSYDNNLASWTMSAEYGLKKDRDRGYFAGQFLWSGIDYIGEPTPYNVFPVKASFFGAVDTAGFAKDAYFAFQSQWTTEPMVHLVPMNWTDHQPGEPVSVWAYSTVDTVELFLNGRSLGVRTFDHKTTSYGRPYLETTEATFDDKTVTSGPFPGSYTSPNGSAGKLHLTWDVPYEPGALVAVARRGGAEVARDEVRTAGVPRTLRLTPDKRTIAADGTSLSFVTVDVVDAAGTLVPSADNQITFSVHNGRLVGLDNGRQESAENYKSSTRSAFNGKALAIVQSGDRPGPITITATAPGLRPARATVFAGNGRHANADEPATVDTVTADVAALQVPSADASFSGAPTTLPAAMLDGNSQSGGWSNFYNKSATALLPAVSAAHEREWVSVSWPTAQSLGTAALLFTIDTARALPAAIDVKYWNGQAFVPVTNPNISWATASNQPTTITFDPVSTTRLRFDLTSRAPNTRNGFLQITELQTG